METQQEAQQIRGEGIMGTLRLTLEGMNPNERRKYLNCMKTALEMRAGFCECGGTIEETHLCSRAREILSLDQIERLKGEYL